MKAKCYMWVIGRRAVFYSRNDGRLSCMPFVGASLLAKIVNDNAPDLNECGVLEFFASKLAPTEGAWAIQTGKKSPAKLAGLRYERGARKSLQPGLPGEGEAAAVYSRMVRMSFSNWLRRWVKRAAAAPLITR